MEDPGFFDQIPQVETAVGDSVAKVPCFYQDVRLVSLSFRAPLRALQAVLPSPPLSPLRAGPRYGIVSITAFQARESDVGPYSSVSIGVPVKAPGGAGQGGIIRFRRKGGTIHVLHSVKSAQVAVDVSSEILGLPALLADVQWDDHDQWLACRVDADHRHLLTLEAIRPATTTNRRRLHLQPTTKRENRLLRGDLTLEFLEWAEPPQSRAARVVFGDHPIVQHVHALEPGRLVFYRYVPLARAILGPPRESWPANPV